MDKSLAQSKFSKSKPVSSLSESEDDCIKNAKQNRNYKIRAFLENYKFSSTYSYVCEASFSALHNGFIFSNQNGVRD